MNLFVDMNTIIIYFLRKTKKFPMLFYTGPNKLASLALFFCCCLKFLEAVDLMVWLVV